MPSSLVCINDISPGPESGYLKRVVIAAYGFLLLAGWYAIPWLPLLLREAARGQAQMASGYRRVCMGTATFVLLVGGLPLALKSTNVGS